MKDYFTQNKSVLFLYILSTFLFYCIIFLFFRKTQDLPADLIFSMVYIVFMPGIITLITLLKTDMMLTQGPKEYFRMILIHAIIPIIISMVFVSIYDAIRVNFEYWERLLFIHIASVPISMAALIIVIEVKNLNQKILYRILGFALVTITFLISSSFVEAYSVRHQNSDMLYVLYGVYFYLIPLILLATFYKKKTIQF